MTPCSPSQNKPPDWSSAWQRQSRSAKATQALAETMGARATLGTVIGLVGPMGAGKTTFVQGLAKGWGVENLADVTSPTYALVNIYPAQRGALVHVDLYRLADIDSAIGLGLEETLAESSGLIVVEWGDHLLELMPQHTAWLRLTPKSASHRLLEGIGLEAPPQRGPR